MGREHFPSIILTPSEGSIAWIVEPKMVTKIHMPAKMSHKQNRPFGIAKIGNNWGVSNWNMVGVFDKQFKFLYYFKPLAENIHQIVYHNGQLYICNTAYDNIVITDPLRSYSPFGNTKADTKHINSIAFRDDQMFFLTHNLGLKPSELWTNGCVIAELGMQSHSLCFYDTIPYVVDSIGGRILGTNGFELAIAEEGSYSRGMAITPEGLGVVATFDFSNRLRRHLGNAILTLFSIPERKILDRYLLENCGNIQDIQLWKNFA